MPTDQTPRPGPRLETGTRTELRLTPRMALGINVLSMSRLELEQMIEVSLTENAALEDSTNDNGLTDEQETEAGRHDDNLASQDEAADGSGDDMVDLLTGDYLGPSLPRQIVETAEFPPIESSLSIRRPLLSRTSVTIPISDALFFNCSSSYVSRSIPLRFSSSSRRFTRCHGGAKSMT